MTTKDFFKPEDFPVLKDHALDSAVKWANKKFNALIESWPVVYSYDANDNMCIWDKDPQTTMIKNYKARLAFIEEIVKECAHEPSRITSFKMSVDLQGNEYYQHVTKCQYCGVELQATWSEEK